MIDKALLKEVSKVVTHADCPDGYASAVILHAALPDAEIRFVRYGTREHEELPVEPGMLFCDFSPPRARYKEFLEAGAIVLDHHKSCAEIVREFERYSLGVYADEKTNPGLSGAGLAYLYVWRELHPDQTRFLHFAELVGVRDTWQKQNPRWRYSCAQAEMLRFYGEKLLIDSDPVEGDRVAAMELGHLLLEKSEERTRELAEHAYRFSDGSVGGQIVVLPSTFISDAADLFPEAKMVVGFRYSVDGEKLNLNYSLRSRGEVDVGAIAKFFGGGGHTRAAGFTVAGLIVGHMNPYEFARVRIPTAVAASRIA